MIDVGCGGVGGRPTDGSTDSLEVLIPFPRGFRNITTDKSRFESQSFCATDTPDQYEYQPAGHF